jgi:Tfp pilus assembly protein FimT
MMSRSGGTLIEMVVTLAVMAIVAAVATLALRPAASHPEPFHGHSERSEESAVRIAAARRAAIAQRHPVTLSLRRDGDSLLVTALPDGRVLADSGISLDPLTGAPVHAR